MPFQALWDWRPEDVSKLPECCSDQTHFLLEVMPAMVDILTFPQGVQNSPGLNGVEGFCIVHTRKDRLNSSVF